MNETKFVWTVGEHVYVLVPEVRFSPRRLWLLGAGMYSLAGDYIGYWHRRQMPVTLIRDLTTYARENWPKEGRSTHVVVSPDVRPKWKGYSQSHKKTRGG